MKLCNNYENKHRIAWQHFSLAHESPHENYGIVTVLKEVLWTIATNLA